MKRSDEYYDIEHSYPMQIRACLMVLQDNLNKRFLKGGFPVTHGQWKILTYIRSQEGLSQQELARIYGSSKVTIARFIATLEKQGLVLSRKDPQDRRKKHLYLTEEGKRLQAEMTPVAKANSERLREGLSDAEIDELLRMLKIIITNGGP